MTNLLRRLIEDKNVSKKTITEAIENEFRNNIKDFDNGNLTYEEFHFVQRELIQLKNQLGI